MTSSDIQEDSVNAIATEITNAIINEFGNELFTIIVDESCEISQKEQLDIALHYVTKTEIVVERFLGIIHVTNIVTSTLKDINRIIVF
mgnify:FL=1